MVQRTPNMGKGFLKSQDRYPAGTFNFSMENIIND
jgi:hypothetical protein